MSKVFLVSFVGMQVDNDSSILTESLKKRGIETKSVCWDDPTVDWTEPNLCIIKSATNYILDSESFIRWAKEVEKTTPVWNNSNLLEWNSDKWYLKELESKGVQIPPSVFISKGQDNPSSVIMETRWDEIVIKPTISAGSFGLKRFKSGSEKAGIYLGQLLNEGFIQEFMGDTFVMPSCDAIIQPFIPEIMEGEVSLIFFGGEFSHSVIKKVPVDDFRAHPVWGASVESYTPSMVEFEYCDLMFGAIESVEYARVDLVNTVQGPMLIELELIEPFMFFDLFPDKAENYVDHIENFLKR